MSNAAAQQTAPIAEARPEAASPLAVRLIPILSDNYAYLIEDDETGEVGVIDPGEAGPVADAVRAAGGQLDWILLTHHHADHIGGAARLKEMFGARIAGAATDVDRLPTLDVALESGVDWTFGAQLVEILDTPGHTVGHIAYYFPRGRALFAGDTLFALGCGRLFEGAPAQMWSSLSRLAELPPETKVFAGHEYTLSNARFALGVEPDNAALRDRAKEIETLRASGKPTLPTTIGREMATNPFLRAARPELKAALGLLGADDAAVFAEIRRRKDAA